jgi:MFS family permease
MGHVPPQSASMYRSHHFGKCYWNADVPVWSMVDWIRESLFIGHEGKLTFQGCTAANTAAKSYVAEITSPASRGRWMGVLNSFYYVGQILAAGISVSR